MHIVPHLKVLTMVTDKVFVKENMFQVNDKDIAEKCESLANICEMHCEFHLAKKYLEFSLNIKHEKLGPEHVNVATSHFNLASIYQDLGDFEQAKEYQQRALEIQLDKLGSEPGNDATSYQN